VGDVAAVASAVDAPEFSEEALAANVRDAEWITQRAFAHESVLDRLLAERWTLIPFRFGTLYAGHAQVEHFLQERQAELVLALELVDGRIELGLRASFDLELAAELRGDPRAQEEGPGAGAAYLRRRGAELQQQAEQEAEAQLQAGELHRALAARAAGARLNAVRAEADERRLPILNAAYLVDRSAESEFRALAESLAEQSADSALRIDVSGPWPPYNFVPPELAGS
jgi:gas vesicle protein GvpL/GvpF